jgi:CDP-glucose 4,6-dehydratase
VLDLVKKILERMQSALEPEILNQQLNEIRHQYLSAERARTVLDWAPRYTLEEGLDRTIGWYREFLGGDAVLVKGVGQP